MINNKSPKKIIFSNNKTYTNRSAKNTKTNKDKMHSEIYNYEGLQTAFCKYNSHRLENKSNNSEIPIRLNKSPDIESDEKINYINKLKEMNSNMDLILIGLKGNLEGASNNKEKKIINIDNFMQKIDINKKKSLFSNIKANDIKKDSFEDSFSSMSVTNFNFEIINKKKYFIDINELNDEEKIKLKYIYDYNIDNKLDLDEIINNLYDYKIKFENLKNSNNLYLDNNLIDEEYFKEIIEKRFEYSAIENDNKILKKEINILIESLANSFYKGDLLLNRYYNKLKQIEESIQKNINDITDDVLK